MNSLTRAYHDGQSGKKSYAELGVSHATPKQFQVPAISVANWQRALFVRCWTRARIICLYALGLSPFQLQAHAEQFFRVRQNGK